MRGTNIITINGRQYDAITGMPMKTGESTGDALQRPQPAQPKTHTGTHVASKPQPAAAMHHVVKPAPHRGKIMSDIGPRPAAHHTPKPVAAKPAPSEVKKQQLPLRQANPAAHHVHQQTQRSQTLHRGSLKNPLANQKPAAPAAPVQKSPHISKFALHQPEASAHHVAAAPASEVPKPIEQTIQPNPKKQEALKGRELKEHLIREQMRRVDTDEHDKPKAHRRPTKKHSRLASIVASVAALVVLGGYLTYLNLPSLSIRVAATQAGVDASYPNYQPSGYSFAGPVAFSPGEVRVNFASNTNDYSYSLVQRASSWDSQAVLDNYVTKETEQYATLQERGLTIYLMENKAAWVNGGVLYTIEGNAPLSSEQIQKIASSTL